MIRIASENYRATLDPERGGLIAGLQTRIHDGWIDLLRPDPGETGFMDGLPLFGCFPMAPFANRLSKPWLPSGTGARPMPVNWPLEGLAMHGIGFMQAWQVEEHGQACARIATDLADDQGQMLGSAEQNLSLDDAGFRITLSFENHGSDWVEAGLGLHPWFHAPIEEREISLTFAATGQFEMSQHKLPENHFSLVSSHVDVGWGQAGLDTCFSGWHGTAHLTRPDVGIRVTLQSESPLLHCFVAPDFDAICAEPVSHAPNAAHASLPAGIARMTRLMPRESLTVEMTISAAPYGDP